MKVRRWLVGGLALVGLGLVICLATAFFRSSRLAPEAVLAELETLTPLGSTVAEVETAIRKGGWQEGMGGSEAEDGRKASITARYADHYRSAIPPERMIIEAHWHFDPEGKLHDISLDYYSAGFIAFGLTKENQKPIRLSDRAD